MTNKADADWVKTMFGLGFFELLLFGLIALVVLGPEKLPEFARTLGKWYGLIRRTSQRLQHELVNELELAETQALLKAELAKMRESEAQMKARLDAMQARLSRTEGQAAGQGRQILDSWQTFHQTKNAHQAQDSNNGNLSAHTVLSADVVIVPMAYHWFLLGEYDCARRLPSAPFLPNYQADHLFYQSQPHQSPSAKFTD